MAYKSILTVWDGRDISNAALDLAIRKTRQVGGHLNVLCLGIDRMQSGLYYAGATPALLNESIDNARAEAARLKAEAEARLEAEDINWSVEAQLTQSNGVSHVVGNIARFNDLTILPRPYDKTAPEEAVHITEAALFDGHCPVLVLPGSVKDLGQRIIVAWNESSEAMAAIRAALPLLVAAEAVDVAIIDPTRHDGGQADPGSQLSRMLARHGVNVSVSILARTVPRISEVLQRHAGDIGADMIVMGAYGHSRFRESIMGGATRDMLEETTLPVLMGR